MRIPKIALLSILSLLVAPAFAGDGPEDCYNGPDYLQVTSAEQPESLRVSDAELAAVLRAIAVHEGRAVRLAALQPEPRPASD